MPYISTAERIGMEKGESLVLHRLLKHKFGEIKARYLKYIEEADEKMLLDWNERVLDAKK